MSSDSTDKDATGVAVRRFDDCDVCGGMVMSDCGGYVSIEDFRAEHADYLALQAQYAALKAAADAVRADMFIFASDLLALQAQYDALRKTLLAIANAKPSEWDPDVRDQFQLWAQNIARAATGEGQL
jgi:hypothetical protein